MQLSRIAGASYHSVNLVPCPAPAAVGDLPPGLISVDDFHAETFQDSRIGPWRPGHIDRYAPAGAPGLDAWDGDSLLSLDLQSKTLLCELLDRLDASDFPKFLLRAGVVGIPKHDGSPDRRPLTVMSCIWRMWSRRIARHTGIWMDRWMPPSIFGARPCAAASDGAWELLMDIDESRVNDQDLTILTLVQKQRFDRQQLASLRELGLRLGMSRLALVALEAYGQLEIYPFIDGQPTSMLMRGGDLREFPQECALSVHFCNLTGWAGNLCMKREFPHVRTNAYLDDRLVSADSCDPLPRNLEITKQVDDYFGAVLNSKKSSWTSTKLPSRRRKKLCKLIDYTSSLVYLGVDVLMRRCPVV